MVDIGDEFGIVTGRRSRCGWLDLVALRYAIRVSGITEFAIMKFDVLPPFDPSASPPPTPPTGARTTTSPGSSECCTAARPSTRSTPDGSEDITGVRSMGELPKTARDYLARIEADAEGGSPILSLVLLDAGFEGKRKLGSAVRLHDPETVVR